MRYLTITIMIFSFWSCQSPSGERAVTGEAREQKEISGEYEIFYVDTGESNVEWIGARPASQHNGIVSLSEGFLNVDEGQIVGGEFTIDLTDITVLDITDPSRNARLKGHLESDDFFDVENHPEATFTLTDIESTDDADGRYRITGNLLMRGVNRAVTFDADIDINDEQVSARSVQFVINRTEWGVNYQSRTVFGNVLDNFILDDIALVVNLVASR
jgi:polyisoprenoid-binding protein YceI